jgi:hypothetical protein
MRMSVLGLLLAGVLAAGCTGAAAPREKITFAVLSGAYIDGATGATVEGAVVEDSESLLRKAVADFNARKELEFVVVVGDLLARPGGAGIDRAKAILDDLKAPYYVVLGSGEVTGAAVPPKPGAKTTPDTGATGTGAVTWAFQGKGFSGPEGYWSREVSPGLVLVALDTVQPGRPWGHVNDKQLEWLDRTLSEAKGKSVIVAAYHQLQAMHPLDESDAWHYKLVDNAPQVRTILEKNGNVVAVVAGDAHYAAFRSTGRILYMTSPSLSVWPLAYHLVLLGPKEIEATWVPAAPEALVHKAQNRLLETPLYRGVFPAGEDGDTACIRLFGGRKLETMKLPSAAPAPATPPPTTAPAPSTTTAPSATATTGVLRPSSATPAP